MIAQDDFTTILNDHCLVRGSVRVLPRGHIRADTRLMYPDGAAISIFVEQGNLKRTVGYALSDFGKTFAKLDEYGASPFRKSRLRMIEETVGDLQVRVMNDRLVVELMAIQDLDDGVFNLAQACLRASCLIFTRRSSYQRTIHEKVHDIVKDIRLPYEANYKFSGPYNSPVKVDYRVTGPSISSSLLVMSGKHDQANEVFRRWYDLKKAKVTDQFLTVYDEQQCVRSEDIETLQDISKVVSVSHPKMIERLLKAAA